MQELYSLHVETSIDNAHTQNLAARYQLEVQEMTGRSAIVSEEREENQRLEFENLLQMADDTYGVRMTTDRRLLARRRFDKTEAQARVDIAGEADAMFHLLYRQFDELIRRTITDHGQERIRVARRRFEATEAASRTDISNEAEAAFASLCTTGRQHRHAVETMRERTNTAAAEFITTYQQLLDAELSNFTNAVDSLTLLKQLGRIRSLVGDYFKQRKDFEIHVQLADEQQQRLDCDLPLPLSTLYTELCAYDATTLATAMEEHRRKLQQTQQQQQQRAVTDVMLLDDVLIELDKKAEQVRCTADTLHQHIGRSKPTSRTPAARVVLLEGLAGVGKSCFARHLCQRQLFPDRVAVLVDLPTLESKLREHRVAETRNGGSVDMASFFTADFLLRLALADGRVLTEPQRQFLANSPPDRCGIIWVLDGLDEVQETNDAEMQWVLRHFISPLGRRDPAVRAAKCIEKRSNDIILVCSRGQRLTSKCDLREAECWVLQPWTMERGIPEYVKRFTDAVRKTLIGIDDATAKRCTDNAFALARSAGLRDDAGLPGIMQLICAEAFAPCLLSTEQQQQQHHAAQHGLSRPRLYLNSLRRAWGKAAARDELTLNRDGKFDEALTAAGQYAFDVFRDEVKMSDAFTVKPEHEQLLLRLGLKKHEDSSHNNRGNAATSFRFKFQHRRFLEFFAARHMIRNYTTAFTAMKLTATRGVVWLFVADMVRETAARITQPSGFFSFKTADEKMVDAFVDTVTERFKKQYDSFIENKKKEMPDESKRREFLMRNAPDVDEIPIRLIVELAAIVTQQRFFDSLERDLVTRAFRADCPFFFWWMIEHCGSLFATDLLRRLHRSLKEKHGGNHGDLLREQLEKCIVRAVDSQREMQRSGEDERFLKVVKDEMQVSLKLEMAARLDSVAACKVALESASIEDLRAALKVARPQAMRVIVHCPKAREAIMKTENIATLMHVDAALLFAIILNVDVFDFADLASLLSSSRNSTLVAFAVRVARTITSTPSEQDACVTWSRLVAVACLLAPDDVAPATADAALECDEGRAVFERLVEQLVAANPGNALLQRMLTLAEAASLIPRLRLDIGTLCSWIAGERVSFDFPSPSLLPTLRSNQQIQRLIQRLISAAGPRHDTAWSAIGIHCAFAPVEEAMRFIERFPHRMAPAAVRYFGRLKRMRILYEGIGFWHNETVPALLRLVHELRHQQQQQYVTAATNAACLLLAPRLSTQPEDAAGLEAAGWISSGDGDVAVREAFSTGIAVLEQEAALNSNLHRAAVTRMRLSGDRSLVLLTASDDGTAKLWSSVTGACLRTFDDTITDGGCTKPVTPMTVAEFSTADETLIATSRDAVVKLWNRNSGELVHTLRGHTDLVWSVTFSPDGRWIASGGADTVVRLWAADTGAPVREMHSHTSVVWSVAFSSNSQLMASGSSDRTAIVWDVATGRSLHTLGVAHFSKPVTSVAFCDAAHVAVHLVGQSARLWKFATENVNETKWLEVPESELIETSESNLWFASCALVDDTKWNCVVGQS